MNHDLIFAVVFMTSLFVILKFFERWKVNNLHGLTVNYFTASLLSFIQAFTVNIKNFHSVFVALPLCMFMGTLFISVFYLTAYTSQRHGISTATIASKMSVVIPVLAGVIVYKDSISFTKFFALLCALTAVYFTGSSYEPSQVKRPNLIVPFFLFMGAGTVDMTIKYAQFASINKNEGTLFFSAVFAMAGIVGIFLALYLNRVRPVALKFTSAAAGVLLGVCNYASLIFLLRALGGPGADSGVVFTLANVGVVLLSVLCSVLIFKERLSVKGISGIILALFTILLLTH